MASTHEAATTVTVRQGPSEGIPVRGSMMWWRDSVPRVQRLTVVLEVATPPDWIRMVSASGSTAAALSSAIWTCHPSKGGAPAVPMSPPRLTRTPHPASRAAASAARSAARALAVEPRSISTSSGTKTMLRRWSRRIRSHPGTGPGGQRDRTGAAWDGLEVGVVPGSPERRSHGGIHQAVGEPGGAQRSPEGPGQGARRRTPHGRAADAGRSARCPRGTGCSSGRSRRRRRSAAALAATRRSRSRRHHLHRGAHDRVASDSHIDHLDLPSSASRTASSGQVATARRA